MMARKKTSTTLNDRQRKILHWTSVFMGGITVITSIPTLVIILTIGMVPDKYLYVIIPVYLIIVGLALWRLLARPKRIRTTTALLAIGIIISGINIYAFGALRATGQFLSGIQQPSVRYVEYVVIAKKKSSVTVDSAKTASIISSDTLYKAASEGLKVETNATQTPVENVTQLTETLNNHTTELAALRKANYEALEEDYAAFYKNTVVLATYKVRDTDQAAPTADTTKPFALYISGIDTYGNVTEVSRSDVNILAVVNPAKRTMLLVNTPRDYYVPLHGKPGINDKLTHAGIYGIDTSRQTLSDLYKVDIPYYARLNFTSLVKMVDVIGDITVYSDYSFKSFHAGNNVLNSKRALEFARERYSFSDGDRQRGRNQQKVVEAIIAKLSEPKNMMRYNSILATLQGSLQTNMSKEGINALAKMQLNDMKRWKVESISVDGDGTTRQTYSMGAQPLYVMLPNQSSVEYARSMIDVYLEPATE